MIRKIAYFTFTAAVTPSVIKKKSKANSYTLLIGVLYLTIDKAPTKPNDNAKENFITVITKHVIIDKGINKSEKYSLFDKV